MMTTAPTVLITKSPYDDRSWSVVSAKDDPASRIRGAELESCRSGQDSELTRVRPTR